MTEFSLRPATAADRDFLWDLYLAAMAPYVAQVRGTQQAQDRQGFEGRLRLTTTQIITVAERDVGMMCVVHEPRHTVLYQIALLPEFQKRGIGAALMQGLMDECAREGRMVKLEVLRCNPAWQFYERLGFAIIASGPLVHRMVWQPPAPGSSTDKPSA